MLEAVLIDDEIKALQSLTWELTNFSDEIKVVASFTDPYEALSYLEKNKNNPNALFTQSASEESGVIGFAADGFPIFGSYVNDKGQIRKVTSSYQLKAGDRPIIDVGGSSANYSQRPYNGAFRQDYEYVEGSGNNKALEISRSTITDH